MYKNKTPKLRIPYVGYGDRITPEEELTKYTILENQVLASKHGLKCCVFEEGDFRLRKKSDILSSVTLDANGAKKSAVGIVGGFYFEAEPKLTWDNLKNGLIHYLYIKKTAKLKLKTNKILLVSSPKEKSLVEESLLLMAVVDLRKDKFLLDTKPPRKIIAKELHNHVGVSENPHGTMLVQDNIEVKRKLTFDATKEDSLIDIYDDRESSLPLIKTTGEIILQDKRCKIKLSDNQNNDLARGDSIIGAINECLSQKRIYLDFEGEGNDTLSIPDIKRILAVNVTYKFNINFDSEVVTIGYHEDGLTREPFEFAIFSKGQFSVRFVIDCEV